MMRESLRRKFTCAAIILAGCLLVAAAVPCFADEKTADAMAETVRMRAERFLSAVSQHPLDRLTAISLTYDVHLKVAWNVRMKMAATIWVRQEKEGFASSFSMTEPEGVNGWSWLMLSLFGRHTREYKEMVKGIETRLVERFRFDGKRFKTDVMEEILPGAKEYRNQTEIQVRFKYRDNLIQFWEDKRRSSFTRTLPYSNQIGPLTAFFNYLYFDPPETEMAIINVLKQALDDPSAPGPEGHKQIRYLFETQQTLFGSNMSGKYTTYPMAVTLNRGNFLDIIFGDYLYYHLARKMSHNLKTPYEAHVEGIISKRKKRKKLRQLKKKYPFKTDFEKELMAEVDDILAARNIKVYLSGFDVSFRP